MNEYTIGLPVYDPFFVVPLHYFSYYILHLEFCMIQIALVMKDYLYYVNQV